MLNNLNYLLGEVPDDAYDFRYKTMPDEQKQLVGNIKDEDGNIGTCYINDNPQGEIIGKISNILKDEDVCKGLVKEGSYMKTYHNYITNDTHKSNQLPTATKSFSSYLHSIDLDLNKSWLLIQKL